MAVTITISDVRQLNTTRNIPDAVITSWISLVDAADSCLDTNNVPADQQTGLKLNAVWHLAELFRRGSVQSEKSPTGASRTYSDKEGFQSTPYGQILQSMDRHHCLRTAIGAPGKTAYFMNIRGITNNGRN